MTNLIGQSLGRYHILEQLGEGGMATVYKAYDTRLERDVAIKVIRVDQFPPAALERILKRFEREAKALARLTHPNIVHINDYGEHGNVPYLVMDYLSGGTLKERMKGKSMPWQEAVRMLIPIASALEYAHEHNVVHRDVKPANILLTEKGQSMLSDFGIAKILELDEGHTLTGTGMGVGTPEYMSPEQGLGKEVDGRADIYSMGIIFYELITGRKPYSADTPMAVILKHTTDPLPRPRQFLPNLPDAVERVLLKALAKGPADRYPDAGAFANAMEDLISGNQAQSVSNEQSDDSLETMDTFATNVQFSSESNSRNKAPASVKKENIASTNLPQKKSNLALWIGLGVTGIVLISALVGWLAGGGAATVLPTSTPLFTVTPIPTKTSTPTSTPLPTSTPTNSPTPSPMPNEIVDAKGVSMRLVPKGEFTMGDTADHAQAICQIDKNVYCFRDQFLDEEPMHRVFLESFYLDKYEVTNELYKDCEDAGKCEAPKDKRSFGRVDYYGNPEFDNYPVINVNWEMSKIYCEWREARLPTEAEWEKAARGTDGRTYPWGDGLNEKHANIKHLIGDTTRVGSYESGKSVYGIYDLAGNVWEFVSSLYKPYPYNANDGREDLITSGDRVFRGGGVNYSFSYGYLLSSHRWWIDPLQVQMDIGFRCARSAP